MDSNLSGSQNSLGQRHADIAPAGDDDLLPGVALNSTPDSMPGLSSGVSAAAGAALTAYHHSDSFTGAKMEATSHHHDKARRETLKVQKKVYRKEKKKAAKEILTTLRDPSVILMADYLKVRGMLKSWTKFWCVLKPGVLILYKSQKQKSRHWVGTIILNSVKLIERPSKKDGFCFKIYHPLEQSIWAQKGPQGETYGAITQPLMYNSAIFRAPSVTAGKTWMDALELALKCSSLLLRSEKDADQDVSALAQLDATTPSDESAAFGTSFNSQMDEMNENEMEDHFKDLKENGARTEAGTDETDSTTGTESDDEGQSEEGVAINETTYTENEIDIKSTSGPQAEEFADENKNIIWCLMKQVRPGMDLSKVTLPTFILEPRSLLEKFADYYYHCDILSRAARCDGALMRMKEVVRWYISGFYKTPKGVKKPYNPILGEKFRCYWYNPETESRTFYIAEQISHHPPMSAFYVTNRRDGFSLSCTVLAKSKFYGNSVSAVMDGVGKLTFLNLGEEYSVTMPYGYAKGILLGSLTMELGGKVKIACERTGYSAELEFKLKPWMGGSDSTNKLSGKIKMGAETLYTLDGKWDEEVFMKEKSTGKEESFWKVDNYTFEKRLKRYTVPIECQQEFESERLWQHVKAALLASDQEKATNEKFILEEAQRNAAKERKLTNTTYHPGVFEKDERSGDWVYKYADMRPWDEMNDLKQYETDFKVMTQTKHKTPLVRQTSIINVNRESGTGVGARSNGRSRTRRNPRVSASSTPSHTSEADVNDHSPHPAANGDMTSSGDAKHDNPSRRVAADADEINLEIINRHQRETADKLRNIQSMVVQMSERSNQSSVGLGARDWLCIALLLFLQTFLQHLLTRAMS